jgi:hypothetical protein
MSHNKIIPTGRQKMIFVVHLVAFLVGVTVMFLIHAGQEKAARAWVYPWHAWIIAAWGLAVIGHMCALWTSYEDPGMRDYEIQTKNG